MSRDQRLFHLSPSAGFTCYDFNGAKMCLSRVHFTNATFASPPSATCVANADSRSGICDGSACRARCDSPRKQTCEALDESVCLLDLVVTSLQWQPNFVTACVPGQHGAGAVGTTCTNDLGCRSRRCHLATGQCTDSSRHDLDCPASHRCKTEAAGTLSDGTAYFTNLCLPAGF